MIINSLQFEQVPLLFAKGEIRDVFARKNNRTVEETIEQRRYRRLAAEVRGRYADSLTKPLGEFLYERKRAHDLIYRKFLNGHGDGTFCDFSMNDQSRYQQKGLYAFVLEEAEVVYIGRCLNSFRERINRGYGRICPKNCYLDGQATNCHLNSLIGQHQERLTFYVYLMIENDEIIRLEKELIRTYSPAWNTAFKEDKTRRSKRRTDIMTLAKNTICLWYDGDAEEAARFYAETFPDSSVEAVHKAPGDFPDGTKGQVLTVNFTVMGIPCMGLNGGPTFKHNEAFSFQVATTDQAETDRYWNAIVGNGGEESACGWCKDKWGLSWQITPIVLSEGVTDPDPAVAKRVFDAMMTMKKIDIAAIEAARHG